ncbi:E3 ubiquitin-protein ligase Os04g0590900-like [Phragmites australis]|uniref:E3 ubiquitin-protein ligase Os04g0590900-like n=1 Tax=Phragmites australis TaxID=29695 RepID=UPI002D778F6D|nr:E3 ubiquitin-protein ligase Os04g0590900-like [Phragmites australis]
MHTVSPHATVTVNCTETPFDCLPLCPGGARCSDYALPPPPPIPVIPRAPDADRHAPARLLLIVSLLSVFLFLSLALSTLLLYRRRRLVLRRRRRAAAAASGGALPGDDEFGDGDEEEGGGRGRVVHHVWYIRTVGLDEATIASIATVEYRGGVGRGGDCAVCLGEFSDGELVRLLPRCAHPFHAPCIDTWLRAHVNCPLCRSPVAVPADLPAAVTEAEADGAQQEEREVVDEMSLSNLESQAEVSVDTDASSDTQSEDTAAVADENGRVTPMAIRRSASMDSPLFLVAVPEAQDDDVQSNCKLSSGREMRFFRVGEKEAAGTSSSSCQAGRFKIGRSMSSSGLGFFFSRNGRSSGTMLRL